ncbi:transcriptional regulator, AbrB family [Rhizobium sp. PDO1-076]|uniref:AbrB/MazE/SpoVT family DNA-binding domain-containing protein n=1 Tax=Rhizobium sp. PDO1-076 TaxID=1125979 RepID=UPI00024E246E|nr:AbrB/MazE/SpoVT family DNA-binding domain-containing protein [Rhizobium sp. PDO1-076]EHS48753.1 transcriptional regulator, AbrB family [Rhizobium sp. PDO1-076]
MGSNITITSKGQLTIPKDLREQLNVQPGDKCYAWVRNGQLVIIPRNKSVRDLAAILGKPPAGALLPDEEIDDAIMDAAVERFEKAITRSKHG